ncbi:hypothetical protein FRX31_016633 [Thalictrum thalictroides]|uniref:Uncharacterized protein n=1 Tax=Thalictrum thalictroides TaxID=46969 RepID=A0A7J6WAZ1_THATH|nr:hypothetical protein FRX31_016633 [Thalictrum thalictroides]
MAESVIEWLVAWPKKRGPELSVIVWQLTTVVIYYMDYLEKPQCMGKSSVRRRSTLGRWKWRSMARFGTGVESGQEGGTTVFKICFQDERI